MWLAARSDVGGPATDRRPARIPDVEWPEVCRFVSELEALEEGLEVAEARELMALDLVNRLA